jgi:DNA invertase Pin-like site-specific DNA recombinase
LVGPTIRSIRERVKAGLERARANGKILGRPRTDPRVEAKIRRLAGQGMGKGRVARTLGIGVSVAQRVLAS